MTQKEREEQEYVWMDPEIELPTGEQDCIVVVSGKDGNITYVCTPMFAKYNHESDEWVLDEAPEMIPEKVWCWTYLLRLPQVCVDEIKKVGGM